MYQPTKLRKSMRSRVGTVRRVLMVVCLLPLLLAAVPAFSRDFDDEYDPSETGNPLRIVAYVLHPVGVILDTLIFRPAHWLGSKEPIKTLVGKED
jgi:hypothetical protein